MARSEEVRIKGKVSWVKAITPDPTYNKWSVQVHPDQASLDKIRDLQAEGLKNVLKKDEDGYYVSFSRPASKMINGKVQGFAPPVVKDANGRDLPGTIVGNGSDGEIILEVYQHKTPSGGKAKAARWKGLDVTNLIPYNPNKQEVETYSTQNLF